MEGLTVISYFGFLLVQIVSSVHLYVIMMCLIQICNNDVLNPNYFLVYLFGKMILDWRWKRQCSETSAYKIQTPENYPKESLQHCNKDVM